MIVDLSGAGKGGVCTDNGGVSFAGLEAWRSRAVGNKVIELKWPEHRSWVVYFWNKSNSLGGFRRMPGDWSLGRMPWCAGPLAKEEPWEETEARLPTTK